MRTFPFPDAAGDPALRFLGEASVATPVAECLRQRREAGREKRRAVLVPPGEVLAYCTRRLSMQG